MTLKFQSETGDLRVFIDAVKLEQVITNLLSNAFKFTSEHGKIHVSLSRVRQDGRDFAEICVTDTGAGIPADQLPLIFDRFRQAEISMSRAGEGTGIGLALAKEIVELHDGEIKAESKEGFGSTFVVRLPVGKDHLSPDQLIDESSVENPWRTSDEGNTWENKPRRLHNLRDAPHPRPNPIHA